MKYKDIKENKEVLEHVKDLNKIISNPDIVAIENGSPNTLWIFKKFGEHYLKIVIKFFNDSETITKYGNLTRFHFNSIITMYLSSDRSTIKSLKKNATIIFDNRAE